MLTFVSEAPVRIPIIEVNMHHQVTANVLFRGRVAEEYLPAPRIYVLGRQLWFHNKWINVLPKSLAQWNVGAAITFWECPGSGDWKCWLELHAEVQTAPVYGWFQIVVDHHFASAHASTMLREAACRCQWWGLAKARADS
jgi:hypothetical protein